MNKGLEALERITNHIDHFDNDKYIADKKFSNDYITIEKELKALDIFRCIDEESFEEVPESHGTYVRLKTNIYIPKEKCKLLMEVLYRE